MGPTSGESASPSGDVDVTETFAEILDASTVLDALPDAARVVAWASSVLGVWGEDADASEIDQEFLAWLAASDHERAPVVLAALAGVLDVEPAALDAAQRALDVAPDWLPYTDDATATRAWVVRQGESESVGIGFRLGDGSEFSLLADIVDGVMGSLVTTPGPDALFDGSEDLVAPEADDVEAAATRVVDAWHGLLGSEDPMPESVYVNGALAARRLGSIVGRDLGHYFRSPAMRAPTHAKPDPAERAQLNAWAISVLDGAGVGAGIPGPPVLVDPLIPERIAIYPTDEREAFGALEWADWLGAVLGLSRAPAGTVVDPSVLVDLVNRCPEVTSSIPKRDRPYFEWAFSLVLPIWFRAGVLDASGSLTDTGAAHLIAALRVAWS